MKYFFPFLLITIFICSCKKDQLQNSEETLAEMKRNIIKDWKIHRIMNIKPAYLYGTIVTSSCESSAEFSFRSDGIFNYKGNPDCYSTEIIPGLWNLPGPDSLFINFTGNWIIGAYEKLEVSMLTSDTLKWNILASGYNNEIVTQEFTLIPK